MTAAATTTKIHTLPMTLGRVFIATVTETPTTVYLHLSGDRPRPTDEPAVREFLRPILECFDGDDRVLEIDSVRNQHGAIQLHPVARTGDQILLAVTESKRAPRADA